MAIRVRTLPFFCFIVTSTEGLPIVQEAAVELQDVPAEPPGRVRGRRLEDARMRRSVNACTVNPIAAATAAISPIRTVPASDQCIIARNFWGGQR